MTTETNGMLVQPTCAAKRSNYRYLLTAVIVSILLHAAIALNWQPSTVEPLTNKSPKIMEVELVTPPEPKPVEVPKPIVKPKTKPVVPKPKPIPPPKPVESKAPPKVVQKTFTKTAPEVKPGKPAYTPVPVFGTPVAKPSKSTASSTAVSTPKTLTNAASGSPGGGNSGVQVLQRVEPKYPARALSRHMEGKVTVQFTVNASGQVEDASVVSASPSGVFEEAALSAIHRWKFKPKMVSGKPVSQRSVQTINFKLNG